MTWQETLTILVTAALGSLGFSILFYVKPKRLFLATIGGLLTCAVYLGIKCLVGGEFIPNLVAALVGALFSEVVARLTKAPVPVYLVPCTIPLVPGGALYGAMSKLVSGSYADAGRQGLLTLQVALGIAGGIVVASVVTLLLRRVLVKLSQAVERKS